MTTPTLMRGPDTIRRAVAAYLTTVIPEQVAIARSQWGLNEWQLPMPERIESVEPYALDHFPQIGVSLTNARNFSRVDYDDYANENYRARYQCRVFTFVRSPLDFQGNPLDPSYPETIRLRDDYAAIVRSALLLTSSLGQAALMWDEGSLSEEYSEATPVKGDRFVAGVTHTFDVQVDESSVRSFIGNADTINVGADAQVGYPLVTPEGV